MPDPFTKHFEQSLNSPPLISPDTPKCVCDVSGRLDAAVSGREYPYCPVHEPAQHEAQQAARKHAVAQERVDRLQRVHDEMRLEQQAREESAERVRQAADEAKAWRELEKHDPLVAQLTRVSGGKPPAAEEIGIGDDEALMARLTGLLGINPNTEDN